MFSQQTIKSCRFCIEISLVQLRLGSCLSQ